MTLPASCRGWRAESPPAVTRAGVVLTGLGALASLGYVAAVDPAQGGHYPFCPFHAVTGLWCPGCGTLRGLHRVLTGHVGSGIGMNPLMVAVLPLLAWAWLGWAGLVRPPRVSGRVVAAMAVVVTAFTVLRNIPVSPLTALAP